MKSRVLAVDDEVEILKLLVVALEEEGYDVETASNSAEFRAKNAVGDFDLYLIDVNLPDGSGFALVKELRRESSVGIILLTGRSSETDHVLGLEIGADDYVTKPFRVRELTARSNAVLRRTALGKAVPAPIAPATSPRFDFEFDGYRLSLAARMLWRSDGVEIELTTAEFDLLAALLKRRGQVLDRDQLMNAIKGRDWDVYDRAVDGLVSRLRRKIPAVGRSSPYVRTVHGIGYSFTA